MFKLGHVVTTRGISESVDSLTIFDLISRHQGGDWGDMSISDKQQNNDAVKTGQDRIFSSYVTEYGKIWVITEWDRSSTCVLFPSEY